MGVYPARVKVHKETVATQLRSKPRGRAHIISISLYPEHIEMLTRRSWELKLPKSLAIQMLLEVDQRDGNLEKERKLRLTRPRAGLCDQTTTERQERGGLETQSAPLPESN